MWTPSVLLLDSDGKERVRLEGYLPNSDFIAALENGLGRIGFVRKKYDEAVRWYNDVVTRFGQTHYAAEAMYWAAVSQYRKTQDHTILNKLAEDLKRQYPDSVWAAKTIPFLD